MGPCGTLIAIAPRHTSGGDRRPAFALGEEPSMDRRTWDRIVGSVAAVVAIALIVIGGAAVYGGSFGRDNVQDRLRPEKVVFRPSMR